MANGILLLTSFVLMILNYSLGHDDGYKLLPSYDVCNPNMPGFHPPTVYLGHSNESTEAFVNWRGNETHHSRCPMLFKSCPSCQIKVELIGDFDLPLCDQDDVSSTYNVNCAQGCAYLHIFDSDYKSHTSWVVSKSKQRKNYSSQSKQLHVVACANGFYSPEDVSIRIRLSVIQKEKIVYLERTSSLFEFSSPFFPSPYTLNNEEYKYEFHAAEGSYITVTFNDWLISPYSNLKFVNASFYDDLSGAERRPYVISNGPHLSVVFNTGPVRNTGLRVGFSAIAQATFYGGRTNAENVYTNCDQFRAVSGGTLHLGRDIADGLKRDCIFVIRRPSGFQLVQINIIKIMLYTDDGAEIEIREGLTSKDNIIFFATKDKLTSGAWTSPGTVRRYESRDGFYIRLRGRFIIPDSLIIAYASFFIGCTPYAPSFTCANKYCISDFLKCDGYDHCGDDSDEATSICGYHRDEGGNTKSQSSHPSQYSVGVGVVIPVVVSVVLVIIICLVIIFVRRCRRLNQEASPGRHSRGSSNSRGRRHRHRGRNVQMSVTVSSGDNPPSYNEVMQNTPIGQLNMAFAWSGGNSALITQPPSYQEAIGESTPGTIANDYPMHLMARDLDLVVMDSLGEINERAIDVPGIDSRGTSSTLNSLLDPSSYVSSSSSSSSSEDLSARRVNSISSSSDSSTEHYRSYVSSPQNSESDMTNQELPVKEEGRTRLKDERRNKDGNSIEGRVGIMASPSSVNKMKAKDDRDVDSDSPDLDEEIRDYPHTNRKLVEECDADKSLREENRPRRQTNYETNQGASNCEMNYDDLQSHNYGSSSRDREGGRPLERHYDGADRRIGSCERLEQGPRGDETKHGHPRGRYQSVNDGWDRRTHEAERKGDNHRWRKPQGNAESGRSQSMADLSFVEASRGGTLSLPGHDLRFPEADKRFSYAGVGDPLLRIRETSSPYSRGSLYQDFSKPLDRVNERGRRSNFSQQRDNEDDYRQNLYDGQSDYYDQRRNPTGSQFENARALSSSSLAMRSEEASDPNASRSALCHQNSPARQWNQNGRQRKQTDSGNYAEYPNPNPHPRSRPSSRIDGRFNQHTPSTNQGGQGKAQIHRSDKGQSDELCSNRDKRPRPTPRRSIKNSRKNATATTASDQNCAQRDGNSLTSNTAPLTVTNYVAATEDGGLMDEYDGATSNTYPLAQLVFKTADDEDDVYV